MIKTQHLYNTLSKIQQFHQSFILHLSSFIPILISQQMQPNPIPSNPLFAQQQQQLQQGQFQQQSQKCEGESSEYIKTTKAGRKNLCDVCVKALFKYTCPGCNVRSCSLACVNRHKIDRQCAGKAINYKYIEKANINQQTVRKDFMFVKSMLEQTDKVKKTLTGVTAQIQQPKRFYFLRRHARSQYNIKLHQAPVMIERHRDNISFYFMKTKTIYWVIQILYYKGSKKYTRYLIEQPQPDSKTIQQIMPDNFLCQQLLLKQINTQKKKQFIVYIQNRQATSLKTPQKNIHNQQQTPSTQTAQKKQKNQNKTGDKKYKQVSKQLKLCDALRNLNIYQFPTIILVHESLKKSFTKWKKIN